MKSEIILFLFFCYSHLMPPFTLPSFAKINWMLKIAGKRDDGFHEICTIFQTVSLRDKIMFESSADLKMTCSDPAIPIGETNLIIRAARALREKFNLIDGATIKLEKNIPSPGGLGGGSSNAAVTLLGLCRLWNISPTFDDLVEIGASLGSDVPFFFFGGTALGTGRGTRIEPVDEITAKYMLIATPDVDVPTVDAFNRVNAPRLTKSGSKSILQICRKEARGLNLQHNKLKNDFESSVFAVEPEIERLKKTLVENGAGHALLSGSGASVFAVFENEKLLLTAADVLRQNGSIRVNVVKTVSRDEYFRSLKLVESLLDK